MITTAHGRNTVWRLLPRRGREAPWRVWAAGSAPWSPSPQACALLPGIVDYMIEQSGPPSKEVLALKQVQEFLKDGDDVVIIGVFKAASDPGYQLYQEAGESWPSGLDRMPAWEAAAFA